MSADISTRPSDQRRAALRDADRALGGGAVPLVNNFFPIERYYDAAEKVLEAFFQAYERRELDDAYVYGKRFATFSLDALPSHNYYNSSKYTKLREKNNDDMSQVVRRLEKVAQWMDQEEVQKEQERKRREEERKRARIEQIRRQKEKEKAENRRKQAELQERFRQQQRLHEGHSSHSTGSAFSEETAREKLERLARQPRPDEEDELMTSFDSVSMHSDPSRHHDAASSSSSTRGGSEDSDYRRRPTGSRRAKEGGEARRRPSSRGSTGDEERHQQRERRRRRASNGVDYDSSAMARHKSSSPKPSRRTSMPNGASDLPPALAPPTDGVPPPPTYNDVVGPNGSGQNPNVVTAAAGGAVTRKGPSVRESMPAPPTTPVDEAPPSYSASKEIQRLQRRAKKVHAMPVRKLKERAVMEYKSLKGDRRIEVFPLNTYQGRCRHSVNGCAVISPLVVSHHLRSEASVADSEIVGVIDQECNSLLREIRGKLELGADALIIPSDVHDHLVDKKILSQSWFVGATGGNILDPKHVGEFLKLLESGENNSHTGKKTGAALFFREHVVSIVKIPVGNNGKFHYDLIDSMPGLVDSLKRKRATRTRCRDLASFEALIRWYSSSKLSESNCKYIDKHDWDDNMADFDPRVFQAFVWGEANEEDGKSDASK